MSMALIKYQKRERELREPPPDQSMMNKHRNTLLMQHSSSTFIKNRPSQDNGISTLANSRTQCKSFVSKIDKRNETSFSASSRDRTPVDSERDTSYNNRDKSFSEMKANQLSLKTIKKYRYLKGSHYPNIQRCLKESPRLEFKDEDCYQNMPESQINIDSDFGKTKSPQNVEMIFSQSVI